MARNPASVIMRDPVCGMEIDEPRTFTQAQHDGHLYYFCSKACSEEFKTDPASFVPRTIQRQTEYISHRAAH